jgi:hypothetical protein
MKPKHLFELVLLSAVWGVSFLMMRIAVVTFPPVWIALLRCALGASLLWTVLLIGGYRVTLIDGNAQCGGQCVKSLVPGPQLTSLNCCSREQVDVYITNAMTVQLPRPYEAQDFIMFGHRHRA